MATGLDVIVRFIGDASSIEASAAKVEGTGAKLKTWAKGVGVAIGAAFAVKEVKDWISAAEDANVASARLAKTLKNAGDETGKYAKHAEDLATALMKKTGIDDEQIKSGQAILATFHSVSSAAGQQAGIFDRATKSALDLSKTGFGDVDTAAKQLGKALEDPVKGIGALKRAGVNFTDAQKDQIAVMVLLGDKLGAQKLIMQEVENQTKGVAEATATSSDKMKASWHEAQESLGKALLPVLERLAPILSTIAEFVQRNADVLVPLGFAILGVVAAIKLWTIVQATLDAALAANPIGLMVIAVTALYGALLLLILNWEKVWSWIADAPWYVKVALLILAITNPLIQVIAVVKLFQTYWGDAWAWIVGAVNAAVNWIVAAFNNMVAFIRGLPGQIGGALAALPGIIWGAFSSGIAAIPGLLGSVVGWFANLPGEIAGVLGGLASQLYSVGANAMSSFMHGMESIFGSIISKAKNLAGDIIDSLNPFGSPQTKAFYTGQAVMRDLAAGAYSVRGETARAFGSLGAMMPTAYAGGAGASSGGPVSFTINVAVAAGVNPAAVGAATVDAIRAYERVAGDAWRN